MVHAIEAQRIVAGALLAVALGAEGALADAPVALAEKYLTLHRAALESIDPLEIRIDATALDRETGEPEQLMASVRWWRDGLHERHVEKILVTSRDGKLVRSNVPYFYEWSMSPTEARTMQGWDRDSPFPTPLRPGGAHADHYARVKGGILPRDPKTPYRSAPLWLMFCVNSYFGLSELAHSGGVTYKVVEESPDQVRFEFKRARAGDEFPDQMQCWLDGRANWLISRIELFSAEGTCIRSSRVLRFGEPHPGIKVPDHVQSTVNLGSAQETVVVDVRTADIRINESIAPEDLVLEFPEGARVYEHAKEATHIWGRGKPAQTFLDSDALRQWEMEMARANPGTQGALTPDGRGVRDWLLVSNVVIIATIVLLLCLRRRLTAAREVGA